MIVLVDTSVWIRFLANRAPYAATLDDLLSRGEVCGHEFVYGELLMGDTGGRQDLLAGYTQIHQASVVSHGVVAAFVRQQGLGGRGVGWIDAHLLASAIANGLTLWTADQPLRGLATELNVSFD